MFHDPSSIRCMACVSTELRLEQSFPQARLWVFRTAHLLLLVRCAWRLSRAAPTGFPSGRRCETYQKWWDHGWFLRTLVCLSSCVWKILIPISQVIRGFRFHSNVLSWNRGGPVHITSLPVGFLGHCGIRNDMVSLFHSPDPEGFESLSHPVKLKAREILANKPFTKTHSPYTDIDSCLELSGFWMGCMHRRKLIHVLTTCGRLPLVLQGEST